MSDVQSREARAPTIIIADDESSIRVGLSALLEDEGYVVHCAENGKDALRLVTALLPDLVITDLMMPEMSGHELAAAMKAQPAFSHIPVILITGGYVSDDAEHAHLYLRKLTKPFSVRALLNDVRSFLGNAPSQPAK